MEIAVDRTGSPIRAEAGASERAICPHCDGPVILRRRQRSNRPGDTTYFWRHEDNTHLDCPTRYRPGNLMSRIGSLVRQTTKHR